MKIQELMNINQNMKFYIAACVLYSVAGNNDTRRTFVQEQSSVKLSHNKGQSVCEDQFEKTDMLLRA